MTHKIINPVVLATAAMLAACTNDGPAPQQSIPSPFYSPFEVEQDTNASQFGPFVSAALARHSLNHDVAAGMYLEALSIDPDSLYIAERAFFEQLYAGKMPQAVSVADSIIDRGLPAQDSLVHLTSILSAVEQGDWNKARDRIVAMPSDGGYAFLLTPVLTAWVSAGLGEIEGAAVSLSPLIKDDRLRVIGLEHQAYILDYLGKDNEAIEAYEVLFEMDKLTSVQPLISYAYLLQRMGETEKARAFLGDQARKLNNNAFLLREGLRLTRTGAPSMNIATPTGGIGQVFLRLASEFARGRSFSAAIVYLRLASLVSPESSEIYLLLGDLLEKSENPGQAAIAFATVPKGDPNYGPAAMRRIRALKSAGQVDLAIDLLRNLLAENPGSRVLSVTLADMLREESQFAEAIVHYTNAIDRIKQPSRSDWFVFFARGICEEQSGNWEKAEADLQYALSLNPDDPNILNYLGYSWIDRGMNVDQAMDMIKKAVEARPDDGFIVDSLGWVHYLTGDYETAVEHLEKAVKMEPNDVTINDHLGDAYWKVGRKIEARFQWRHALDSGAEGEVADKIRQKLLDGLEGMG